MATRQRRMSTAPISEAAQRPDDADRPAAWPSSARQAGDESLVRLFDIYRLAAGIAAGDELLRRIATARRDSAQRGGDLPDTRASVQFVWRGVQWWPLFQFDAGMAVHPEVARVAQELTSFMADWEVALWFVTPNEWLGDRLPIACVWKEGDATLQAARTDRFIATG
jgi:hypothetical protein